MILVDTYVLIDYLKNKLSPSTDELQRLVENNIEFGICSFVYQELLQGAKDDKEYHSLKRYLDVLPYYELLNDKKSYDNTALINFRCRRKGITIRSSIDLLIAQTAIENSLFLLHHDKDFSLMANVITELKIHTY